MLRVIIIVVSVLILGTGVSSCKKNNTTPDTTQQDSLGVGWSKVAIASDYRNIDVFFVGEKGFCIDQEKIFRSEDNGNSWRTIKHTTSRVENIAMGGGNSAIFVLPEAFKIYYTTDGGNHIDSTAISDKAITDAFFVNANTAFLVGDKLWKTNDGGKTVFSIYDFADTNGIYKPLFFSNELNGWVKSGRPSYLYHTKDGGVTWEKNNFDLTLAQGIRSIFFLDSLTGFVSTSSAVLKTTNGGNVWGVIYEAGSSDVHFITKDLGYVSTGKEIFKTVDGGLTWSEEVSLSANNNDAGIIEIHFTDPNHGWAAGGKGYMLKYEK